MFTTSTHIDADPADVWPVLVDFERWPEWTASMTRLEALDVGPIAVGQRVRVQQPKLPTVVWQITEVDPGRSFSWSASGLGVRSVAGHRIAPVPSGGVDVVLTLDQRGVLAPVLRVLWGRLTRRYMDMEATGLRRRCERTS